MSFSAVIAPFLGSLENKVDCGSVLFWPTYHAGLKEGFYRCHKLFICLCICFIACSKKDEWYIYGHDVWLMDLRGASA